MNIFDYFKASKTFRYVDKRRNSIGCLQDDGVLEVPFDGSYTRWLSNTWYIPQEEPYDLSNSLIEWKIKIKRRTFSDILKAGDLDRANFIL